MLTVVLPVVEPEPFFNLVVDHVKLIQRLYFGLINEILIPREVPLWMARVNGARAAKSEFIFNLDADTIVPVNFPGLAVDVLRADPLVGAVALDYRARPQGHPAFGASVMRRDVMLQHYAWTGLKESKACECLHTWRRLTSEGWVLSTLPMAAEHKREIPSQHNQVVRPGL